jgi:hypothetical protein
MSEKFPELFVYEVVGVATSLLEDRGYIWVATKTIDSKKVIAADKDYDKCVEQSKNMGVDMPCMRLMPIMKEEENDTSN